MAASVKNLYCVFDTVANDCNAPFLANNDSHARMQFDMAMERVKESGYKAEFKLLYLGFMNMETGTVTPVCEPIDVTFTLKSEDEDS